MKVQETLKINKYLFLFSLVYNLIRKAVSSAVEHLPYKQMATGSNPVPPIVSPTELSSLKNYKLFLLTLSLFFRVLLKKEKLVLNGLIV